jgi:hypothetical protein
VFGQLEGEQVGAMWKMLTGRAPDLAVELVEHDADETSGSARWIARYTFSQTGHAVVNDVNARFRFRDGLIVEHTDRFSFYRWARQALGTRGRLLGWTPQLRLAVLRQARGSLDRAMADPSPPARDSAAGDA